MDYRGSNTRTPTCLTWVTRRARLPAILLCLFGWTGVHSADAAKEPEPTLVIPLNPLGYESPRPELLAAGSAMATLDYVDGSHLLVTFGERRLIRREPGDPPDDDDRLVGAFLIELPSGKVIARTEWHLHDRGQYLWNLGSGRFLLRVRNHLSLLEPGTARSPEQAFSEHPFLHFDRRVISISVSAERDLLVIQTGDLPTPAVILADGEAAEKRAPVAVNFYRLVSRPDHLMAWPAGQVGAPSALALPVNSAGFMDAVQTRRDQWQFHFNSPDGKAMELATFDSSCYPKVTMVSHGEFVAFGCRGADDRRSIGGFNFRGEFLWEQGALGTYVNPTFAFAPPAGRFAMGRTLISSSADDAGSLTSAEVNGQNVRVYQASSGKVLLELNCAPAMRSGQNFALSPDGMHLAVLRETEVQHKRTALYDAYTSREATTEIFDLPPLSNGDRQALAALPKMPAPDDMPRIDLAIRSALSRYEKTGDERSMAATSSSPTVSGGTAPPSAPDSVATASSGTSDASAAPAAAVPAAQAVGDSRPDQTRKAPTLYAPDEKKQDDNEPNGGSS